MFECGTHPGGCSSGSGGYLGFGSISQGFWFVFLSDEYPEIGGRRDMFDRASFLRDLNCVIGFI